MFLANQQHQRDAGFGACRDGAEGVRPGPGDAVGQSTDELPDQLSPAPRRLYRPSCLLNTRTNRRSNTRFSLVTLFLLS